MSSVHLHLLINHIPILGTLFGLLLLVYAQVKRSDEIRKVSLGVFVITALVAILTFGSGLGAATIVQGLPDVSRSAIAQHQRAALITLVAVEILGAMSLLSLWSRRSSNPKKWMAFAVLTLALISFGLGIWAGGLGGEIRHTEIRATSTR